MEREPRLGRGAWAAQVRPAPKSKQQTPMRSYFIYIGSLISLYKVRLVPVTSLPNLQYSMNALEPAWALGCGELQLGALGPGRPASREN